MTKTSKKLPCFIKYYVAYFTRDQAHKSCSIESRGALKAPPKTFEECLKLVEISHIENTKALKISDDEKLQHLCAFLILTRITVDGKILFPGRLGVTIVEPTLIESYHNSLTPRGIQIIKND